MNSTEKIAKSWVCVAALGFLLIAPCRAAAQWATNGNNINNTNSGNVGIGTTAPGAKLDVKDTNNFQVTPNQSAAGEFPTSVLINSAGAGLTLLPDGNGAVGPKLFLGYRDTATPMWRSALEIANTSGYGNLLLMKSGGNVGIGTSNPSHPLTVRAASGTFGILLNNNAETYMLGYLGPRGSSGNALSQGFFQISNLGTATVVLDSAGSSYFTGGNVGIGTMIPSQKVEAYNASGPTYFKATSGSVGTYLGTDGTNSYLQAVAANQKIFISNSAGTALLTADSGTGHVGIGTTTPSASYKLDVNGGINAANINSTGNITAAGSIAAKYQDVAEWVPASHALPAGTVVTLDPTKSNHVEASSQAYDTRVAGVVSEQPGITLGESGESKVLVATTGRVQVTVDASHAPIHIGDLLVTSDIAGVAMKSEPITIGGRQIHSPGTLIGKALEPLEQGSGKILVLLSLQ